MTKCLCGMTAFIEPHAFKLSPKVSEKEKEKAKYFVKFQPPLFRYAIDTLRLVDDYYNFQARPTDVFVMTFPKSGTTWTQEIVWTMLFNKNLGNEEAFKPLIFRSPWLEEDTMEFAKLVCQLKEQHPAYNYYKKLCPEGDINDGKIFLEMTAAMPSPRVIKTHLAFPFYKSDILETAKVIYVARDPKSMLPSFHAYGRLLTFYSLQNTMDEFVKLFTEDKCLYNSYWNHLREAWKRRHHPNLLFIHYEDLIIDSKSEIRKIANFMEVDLTEEQVDNIHFWCSFDEMKKRGCMGLDAYEAAGLYNEDKQGDKKMGKFFRKGTGADWKEALTQDNLRMINDWTQRNIDGFGPDFKYMQNIGT